MPLSKFWPGAAAICITVLGACSRGPLPETPLSAADLPADTFAIQPNRDTAFQTPGGATIAISAGSLQAATGSTARLVVREAYAPGRMLRGALVTLSGSDIVSSGGLIQIGAGAGTTETLSKPLQLRLPASVLKPGMQLWLDTGERQRRFGWQQELALSADTSVQIPAFGWVGAGMLIKDLEGFENSRLLATFDGPEQNGISVCLVLPEEGIVLEGGPAISGGGTYAFYRNDGTVPLRWGKKAVIVGIKKTGDRWLYATKSFTAKADQEIRLQLQPISKADLDRRLDDVGR